MITTTFIFTWFPHSSTLERSTLSYCFQITPALFTLWSKSHILKYYKKKIPLTLLLPLFFLSSLLSAIPALFFLFMTSYEKEILSLIVTNTTVITLFLTIHSLRVELHQTFQKKHFFQINSNNYKEHTKKKKIPHSLSLRQIFHPRLSKPSLHPFTKVTVGVSGARGPEEGVGCGQLLPLPLAGVVPREITRRSYSLYIVNRGRKLCCARK